MTFSKFLRLQKQITLIVLALFSGFANGFSAEPDQALWNLQYELMHTNDLKTQLRAISNPLVDFNAIPDVYASRFQELFTQIAETNFAFLSGQTNLPTPINIHYVLCSLSIQLLASSRSSNEDLLNFLKKIVADEKMSDDLRLISFNAISRLATDSVIDKESIQVCLTSSSDKLFSAAVNRCYNFPIYSSSTNFISVLIVSLSAQKRLDSWKIIRALGFIGSDSSPAIQAIRIQLNSSIPENRAEAIASLSKIQHLNHDDIVKIGKLLMDENSIVKNEALNCLQKLGVRATPAIGSLKQALNSNDPVFVNSIKSLLLRISHKTSVASKNYLI